MGLEDIREKTYKPNLLRKHIYKFIQAKLSKLVLRRITTHNHKQLASVSGLQLNFPFALVSDPCWISVDLDSLRLQDSSNFSPKNNLKMVEIPLFIAFFKWSLPMPKWLLLSATGRGSILKRHVCLPYSYLVFCWMTRSSCLSTFLHGQ